MHRNLSNGNNTISVWKNGRKAKPRTYALKPESKDKSKYEKNNVVDSRHNYGGAIGAKPSPL